MSTEHQRYSTENQASEIGRYAVEHGYEVVRTYADEGISGLSMRGRSSLKQLLADVLSGEADFTTILVYDVSRWGRFQNPDQSAHLEFICSEAGVDVAYCAEMFENDGSMASTLLKNLKRAMAAEYSRELSSKVSAGLRNLSGKGFWVGARAGYGLRRQMVDREGHKGAILDYRQEKALRGFHNILVPGPPDEVAVVQRIYQLYVRQGVS